MKLSKSNKDAGFVNIIIVPLLVVIVGLLGYIIYQNSNISPSSLLPSNTPNQENIDQSDWLTYTNSEVGISLKYPGSVSFEPEQKQLTELALFVNAEKISDIPETLPLALGRIDALKEKADLADGGENTVKVGSLYGHTGMTLALFEVCSVQFNRSLTFYPGDYRVIVTLLGPKVAIMDSMPDFFTVDPTNCGKERMWKQDKISTFEETLAQKKGTGMAQEWYDMFDTIFKTIQITTPTKPAATPISSSSVPAGWSTFKNENYGFEVAYPPNYKALTDKENLYGYPEGVVLLYGGGQAYDVIVETWDSELEYKSKYGAMVADIKVFSSKGKFITVLDSTHEPENKQIIDSFKIFQ